MAVSGAATFDLDIVELVEEAYEQAGIEARSGYDMRTARRSLNLLYVEWANKGYNLWTVRERSIALLEDVETYTAPADVVDLIDFVIRDNQGRDTSLRRIPLGTHAGRNNKQQDGKPVQIFVDRQRAAPVLHLWPVPDEGQYTLVYWALCRIYDAGAFTNTADVPFRFLPATVAGLAHKLAAKKRSADRALIADLERTADRLFSEAADEDRDRSDYVITPEVPPL